MLTVHNKEWIGITLGYYSGYSVSNLYNMTRCLPTCNLRHYSLKESQGYPEIEEGSDDEDTLTIYLYFPDGEYEIKQQVSHKRESCGR